MKSKSVGIMLATYNGEKFLEEQINSIINQTYTNWYLYISDDKSNDSTLSIIDKYVKKYSDRIILVDNKNSKHGAKYNFINVFSKIKKCDYYMFCDQDDVWKKDKIEKMLSFIEEKEKEYKGPILIYCDSYVTDEKNSIINNSLINVTGKKLPTKNLIEHILIENFFPGCAVFFNNDLKKKIDKISEVCEMHDWWVTQVAALCGRIYCMNESLHYYRQHSNNTIGASTKKTRSLSARLKKIFKIKHTIKVWHDYQKLILVQAEELVNKYDSEQNIDVIKKFIVIMKKNRLARFFYLIKYGFVPIEKVRVLRLVI